MVDYNDQEVLRKYAYETVELAEKYKNARISFSQAYIQLDIALVRAYQEKKIKDTISKDKAILQLIALDNSYEDIYASMIENEQLYKGLEKVIDARKQATSQEQSLIKNRINNE